MRIGFVVNDVGTEMPNYTTNRLAMVAAQMGHEVWWIGVGDFAFEPDGSLSARARGAASKKYKSLARYLADVRGPRGTENQLRIDTLDVVMLRSDPADDAVGRAWAGTAGIAFGQLISASGVLVANDPRNLAHALNKAYFQHFPDVVRPRTLISRDPAMIAEFVAELGGRAVLKPLQGSGGTVFSSCRKRNRPN